MLQPNEGTASVFSEDSSLDKTRHRIESSCTMGDLVLRSIERGGNRPAFVSGGISTSYSQLGERLSCVVQALSALNIKRGDAVACISTNTLEAFLVIAAAYVMGVRITNLHPLGSADDHCFIVQDCGAQLLIYDPLSYRQRAVEISSRSNGAVKLAALGPCTTGIDLIADSHQYPVARLTSSSQALDVCTIIYTGGTTGRPKGVTHSHISYVAMVMAEMAEWEWPSTTTFLVITPISHGAGACMMPVLLRSGTVVMENGFSPSKFIDLVERHRVTATFLVPTMIYKILDHHAETGQAPASLELVIYGAAPMAPTRMTEALRILGPVFMQLYGQSEAPNCVTVLRKADHDIEKFPERLASCGQPIFNSQVALLDGQGVPVERGAIGEICVRGPLVMMGYWNNPEETSHVFRHGWLHTGDLAQMDKDGYIYIVGRSKDMIITGGFNVYPAEIEGALSTHPAVSAAAVIGVPDALWGEAVKAVVVLRPGHNASAAEIIDVVRRSKGAICAPKSVEFVNAIPVTPLGKPDKKALRQQFGSASPQGAEALTMASPHRESA